MSTSPAPRVTALAGGIGGARFVRGLLAHLAAMYPDDEGGTRAEVTVIGNTGDDVWLHGVKVCPDLDTVMYTLGGGINEQQGWGRLDESFTVREELAAYGAGAEWFGLGDRDLATHLLRTQLLTSGEPLSAVTARLCERWQPGVRLLPMTDQRVETHVVVDRDGERVALHFQEWWVRYRAALPAHGFVLRGLEQAQPGPGVLEAITEADVVLFPPSNPVVSIGTILSIPGVREAVASTPAPVVGLSPIIGTAPVRGMADACLAAIGVETSPLGVAAHYGARSAGGLLADGSGRTGGLLADGSGRTGGLLDGWLVHSTDEAAVEPLRVLGLQARAVPLLMSDVPATAAMAAEALALAERVREA